jgi:hypothetical protein
MHGTYPNHIIAGDVFVGIIRMTRILDFVDLTEVQKLENAVFRKIDLFPSSGDGRKTSYWVS